LKTNYSFEWRLAVRLPVNFRTLLKTPDFAIRLRFWSVKTCTTLNEQNACAVTLGYMLRAQQVNYQHGSVGDFSDDQLASSPMSCFAEYRSFT
jgi:hypothetical protein